MRRNETILTELSQIKCLIKRYRTQNMRREKLKKKIKCFQLSTFCKKKIVQKIFIEFKRH